MNNIINYEYIDSENKNRDNSSLDVNYNFTDENEASNRYVDENLFKGSHVVLVSDDNPWYVNKGIPIKYISKDFNKEMNSDIPSPYEQGMYDKENYYTNCDMRPDLANFGRGYSYLENEISTRCEPKSKVEGFSGYNDSDNMNRNILIIILVLLVMFYIYRRYKK
jgi:hypothetical protein